MVSGAYDGPAMTIDRSDGVAVVVMTAPSPGWELRFDASREFLGGERVFVTARKPNPRAVYTTQIVEQRVASSTLSKTPVVLYARVLGNEEKMRSDRPYVRVLSDPSGTVSGSD